MGRTVKWNLIDETLFWLALYGDFCAWGMVVSIIGWDFVMTGVVRGFVEFGIGPVGGIGLIIASIIKLVGVYAQRRFTK
jgi:hypothetical protein